MVYDLPIMRKKVLLGIAFLLLTAIAVTFWQAPEIARRYIHKHYPYVQVQGDIVIHWFDQSATIDKVHVTRPGIEADLDQIKVTSDKRVTIHGGQIDVDLDKRSEDGSEGSRSGASVSGKDLTVNVRKGPVEATLEGFSFNLGSWEVAWQKATVQAKDHTVTVFDGGASKDDGQWAGTAREILVPIKLPFPIPRVKREQKVVITHVRASEKGLVEFGKLTLGPFEVTNGRIEAGEVTHRFSAESIKADHPWIAPVPAVFPSVAVDAPHSLLSHRTPGEVHIQLGQASVYIDPINWSVRGSETCNDWLEAMPRPLPKALEQARGGFTGGLKFEVRAKPAPHLEVTYDCTFKCSQEPIASVRKAQFSYEAYDSKGELFTRKTGRHSQGWIALASMGPHVHEAFRLLEDPGFNNHQGIHVMALQNSLKANLESGSFVKGGSTITMQLAKNLWLKRHKTIGRKAMEALLTIALESCMSKPQIMEYYMNVVEYAPDVYGIGPATKHYFRKSAFNITTDEAFFLAMHLPNPKKAITMEQTHRFMRRLANVGAIPEHLIPEGPNDDPQYDASDWVPTN